jgi:biofilm protein TabA
MIVDRLENLSLYCGLLEQLDVGIAFVQDGVGALACGQRVELPADAGYAMKASYAPNPEGERRYEVHRRYIDLQVMLEGEEECLVTDLGAFPGRDVYQEADDLQFLEGDVEGAVRFRFRPGMFAIFFPHDAHKPACHVAGCDRVVKCVVKIER